MTGFNKFELEGFAKVAAEDYLNNDSNLNDRITVMANENSFTDHHIERVVQMANTFVNGQLVKQARADSRDPRVKFDLASCEKISKIMDSGREKEAAIRVETEFNDMFSIDKEPVDNDLVIDGIFGKIASSPYKGPHSVSHEDLTESYISEPDRLEKVANLIDSKSIGLAQQNLETLRSESGSDLSLKKMAAEDAEQGIRDEIHDQILSGVNPASLRAVFNNAYEGQPLNDYMDTLVTKVAANLGSREGKSTFTDGSRVNEDHPLMTKSASVIECLKNVAGIQAAHDIVSAAVDRARADFTTAVSEGR